MSKKGNNTKPSPASAEGIEGFAKFPRTRHIYDAGGSGVGREDLLMDKKEAIPFHSREVIVEEKIDGANLGISVTAEMQMIFQNRSKIITSSSATQWKLLDDWVKNHPGLWSVLTSPDVILFGEWCYARHSIHYAKLPDYFVAFDIYLKDKEKFVSREELQRRLEGSGIAIIRKIIQGVIRTKEEYLTLLDTISSYHDGFVEGVYVRIDSNDYNEDRGKIVRPDFIQNIDDGDHWMKQTLVKNIISYE